MSFDLDQIKLNHFSDKLQVTIFNPDGQVLETCNSVLEVSSSKSIFDQFFFLKSLEEVFVSMPVGEEQRFSEVEWDEGKHGLFHLIFRRLNAEAIQWTIIDNTFYYDKLLNLQQSRNDSAISEEFAQIKRRMIEAENELLGYKNDELERIQQFKSEFFAKVSHEMRNPLNSISGLVDLINKESKQSYFQALKSTSKHLNSIINDILDLSKIESGNLEFESIDFDLNETVVAITTGFEYLAKEKGINLETEIPRGLVLKGDPTRLGQVIYNLVGNSIKFTDTGAVRILIESQRLEGAFELKISIKDTGIGMDEETMSKILEPYQQASKDTSRLYGGTGLGLSIAKQLIEGFGGALAIESQLGKGTKMSFSINLEEGDSDGLSAENIIAPHFEGKKVILAEDDQVSAQIINRLLIETGLDVTLVDKGTDLLDAIEDGQFDLIVSDVNLPGMSGIEVLNTIRAKGNQTPVLFISGDTLSNDLLKGEPNTSFLLKPLDTEKLYAVLNQLCTEPEIQLDLSKVKGMVDDEAFVNDLLETILETLPIELNNLQRAVERSDKELLGKTIHKIKPSVDYLGSQVLIDARLQINEQVQDIGASSFTLLVSTFISNAKVGLEKLKAVLNR